MPAPTDETLRAVPHKTITGMMKLLAHRGARVQEQGATCMATNDSLSDDARMLCQPQVAACTNCLWRRFHGVIQRRPLAAEGPLCDVESPDL